MDGVTWRGLHALSPGLEDVVRELVDQCEAVDGAPARVHWPLASRLRTGLVHRLAVVDGAVVAYGCAYRFDPEDPEVVIAVHPDHRGRGLGRALAHTLGEMVRAWGATSWLGYVPLSARPSTWPRWLEGRELRVERALACRTPVAPVVSPGGLDAPSRIELREADVDDFERIAQLDAESFGSDHALVGDRLRDHVDGVRRRVFVAEAGSLPEREVVGKIHLRDDGEAVFIHDLCIRPAHRGRGLGKAMVAAATRLALELRDEARLEVEAPNEAAVRLYAAVGYDVRASWSVRRYATVPDPVTPRR